MTKFFVVLADRQWSWMMIATLTIVFAMGLPRLYFDDGYEATFRTTDGQFAAYQAFVREFGTEENDVFVVLESANFLTRGALSTVRALHIALQDLEGIESVQSLYSVRRPQRVGRYFLPLLPGDDASDIRWKRTLETVATHPMIGGHFLSADHTSALMVVTLRGANLSTRDLRTSLDAIRRSLHDKLGDTSVKAELTGIPVLRVEIVSAVTFDQLLFGGLGTLLATALAWLIFRDLRTVAIVVAAPVCGVVSTLGLMGLIGEPINVLNCVLSPLLLVIGLSDSVHLMFVIRREVGGGRPVQGATIAAIREVGSACFLTSLTTGIGFGSLAASRDLIIRNFGLAAAAGTILTYVSVMTVVPWLTRWLFRKDEAPSHSFERRSPLVYTRCLDWIIRRPGRVTLAGCFTAAVFFCGALQLRPDFRYTENLPPHHSALRALQHIDTKFAGSTDLSVVVRWPSERGLGSSGVRRLFEDVHGVLRDVPVVSDPISLETLVASLPGQTRSERLRELRFVPKTVTSSFLSPDHRSAAIRARIPDLGSSVLRTAMDRVESRLQVLRSAYPWATIGLEGLSVISTYRSTQMIGDLARSLIWASVAIFVVISFAFRSITWGLASILSNALPILCVAATIHMMGLPLRYGTAIIFTICLGIAVDDTIHVLSKLQRVRSMSSAGGHLVVDVKASMTSVWPALLATTLLLVCGFGVVVFGSFPPMRTFGGLACLGLTVALLSDALVLPATLIIADHLGRKVCSLVARFQVPNRSLASRRGDLNSVATSEALSTRTLPPLDRTALLCFFFLVFATLTSTFGLRRGLDIGFPFADRMDYLQDHFVVWEACLMVMLLAAIFLGFGFCWWSGRVRGSLASQTALTLAVGSVVLDVAGVSAFAMAPFESTRARLSTGSELCAMANFGYAAASLLMTQASRNLSTGLRLLGWLVCIGCFGLGIGTLALHRTLMFLSASLAWSCFPCVFLLLAYHFRSEQG